MCAHSVAADARFMPAAGRLARTVLSGVAVGVLAVATFGAAHALVIAPIWTRLIGGLALAVAASVALAWAFDVWSTERGSHSLASGVQFGTVMYLTMAPATAVDTWLRLSGARRADWLETIVTIGIALISGSVAGRALSRERRVPLVFAAASLALTLASAGPLPIAQSSKGLWLSLSIAPICVAAGASLAMLRGAFIRKRF
jgi:hypothetical protein